MDGQRLGGCVAPENPIISGFGDGAGRAVCGRDVYRTFRTARGSETGDRGAKTKINSSDAKQGIESKVTRR